MEDKELITNATQLLSELYSSIISSNRVIVDLPLVWDTDFVRSICNLKALL